MVSWEEKKQEAAAHNLTSVFVDETGVDRHNTMRKYRYSLRGRPAANDFLLISGERISAIACISLLDVKTVKGTT